MGVRLPAEYQEVEYISGTGIQYIDSGIECTSDLIVDFSFSSTSGENKSVCGGLRQSSGNAYFRHHCTPEHAGRPINFYWIQNSSVGQSSVQFLFTAEKRYYTYINPVTGRSTINGTEFTFTPLPSGLTTGKNYGILGRISYSGAIQAKPSTFYYFKFYRNDALIGDFVPCYRKADSKPGMYDLVTGTFFVNQGTGEFTVGPDVIDSISPWLVARRRIMMAAASVAKKLVKLIATATSGLVSFTTNVIRPVKVVCKFSPVQEGTGNPSPDNVRPISGWTGCDVWYSKSRNLIPLPSGFTTSGFNKQVTNTDIVNALQNNLIPGRSYRCWMEGTYESSGDAFTNSSNNGIKITVGGSNYTMRAQTTMVMPNGPITKVLFISGSSGTSGNRLFSKLLVREVSDTHTLTVDDYEPYYQPTTLPINWQSEAGTVYGGTVTLNEDGSADLLVDREAVDMGTLTFTAGSNYGDGKFMCTLSQRYIATPSIPHLACEVYKQAGKASAFYNGDLSVWYYNNTSFNRLILKDTNFYIDGTPDVSGLHESIDGKLIVLDLRNPQTYHFTSVGQLNAFLGTNNIWHNMNGDITAEYWIKQ